MSNTDSKTDKADRNDMSMVRNVISRVRRHGLSSLAEQQGSEIVAILTDGTLLRAGYIGPGMATGYEIDGQFYGLAVATARERAEAERRGQEPAKGKGFNALINTLHQVWQGTLTRDRLMCEAIALRKQILEDRKVALDALADVTLTATDMTEHVAAAKADATLTIKELQTLLAVVQGMVVPTPIVDLAAKVKAEAIHAQATSLTGAQQMEAAAAAERLDGANIPTTPVGAFIVNDAEIPTGATVEQV